MRNSLVTLLLATLSLLATSTSCVFTVEDDSDGTLTLANDSSFVIEEVRIAELDDAFFGPDLTGLDVLFPGESISIVLACDIYDVLVMDEFGVECEIFDFDVCFGGTFFRITDSLLDSCAFAVSST